MRDNLDLLVLGLGNVLCTDDGAGVEALHRLVLEYEMPRGVLALDGGTLGLSLLPYIEVAERVLLIDAIATGDPPGTLVRIEGDDVAPAVAERLSPHQIGVADLLGCALYINRYPSLMILHGIVPQSIKLGVGCSPPVAAGIGTLVERCVVEMNQLGYPPRRRRGLVSEPDELSSFRDTVPSALFGVGR